MREKEVEQALVRSVRKAGGLCMKFTCPGMDGVPDRLVLLPFGKCAFVELKAPGKKTRPLQIRRMKQITALGIPCYVIDACRVTIDVTPTTIQKRLSIIEF